MTVNYDPNDKEHTAVLKGTLQVTLNNKGNIYPVHIPVVDLPEEIMQDVPEEEKWRGLGVRIMDRAVILCLN